MLKRCSFAAFSLKKNYNFFQIFLIQASLPLFKKQKQSQTTASI
jgi:hypothetical protein